MRYNEKIEYHIDKIKNVIGDENFQAIKDDLIRLVDAPEPGSRSNGWWKIRENVIKVS